MRVLPRRTENLIPMTLVVVASALAIDLLAAFGTVGKMLVIPTLAFAAWLLLVADRQEPVNNQ